jgi:hypothetical protein
MLSDKTVRQPAKLTEPRSTDAYVPIPIYVWVETPVTRGSKLTPNILLRKRQITRLRLNRHTTQRARIGEFALWPERCKLAGDPTHLSVLFVLFTIRAAENAPLRATGVDDVVQFQLTS